MNSTTPNKRIRNITALLLAASTIAACGGSGESSVDDLLGDAQTSSGDADTVAGADQQDVATTDDPKTSDERPEAGADPGTTDGQPEQATSDAVVEGTWDYDIGSIDFLQTGNQVTGIWTDSRTGAINGELDGSTLRGTYYDGAVACDETRDGATNWGTFEFVFADDGLSFDGEYETCGTAPPEAWDGTLLDGPALEPSPLGSNLPATTQYGYLTVTLDSVGVAPGVPDTVALREALDDDEIALVVEVTVDNLHPEIEWSLPHGSLFWAESGGDLYDAVSSDSIVIEPGRDESGTIVFAVPSDVDPSSFQLWLQENARDANTRTQPAFIGWAGDVDEPVEEIRTTSFTTTSIDWGCGGTYTYVQAVLDDDAGFLENGAPSVDITELRSSLGPTLGRAPEGQRFLTTYATATRNPDSCALQVYRIDPNVVIDGSPADPVAAIADSVNGWTDAPSDDIWTFTVPADQTIFTTGNRDGAFGATEWSTEVSF